MKNTKWNFKKVNNAEIAKNNELPLDKDILSILYSKYLKQKRYHRIFESQSLKYSGSPFAERFEKIR